ncbi:membrane or secreted protein [Sabulibacter ruber]|uniref:membrane or secreted protein n=1 Tax=Sabulibacter ruber TaxID=2811901 RepID=UPI001A96B258|nr:membrane or secreted protein [Sabulibacter ruber]
MAALSVFISQVLVSLVLLATGPLETSLKERTASQAQAAAPGLTTPKATELEGAWQLMPSSRTGQQATQVMLLADGFFTVAQFDKAGKKFMGTYGGTYRLNNGKLTATYEFNTFDSTKVGSSITGSYTQKNGNWQIQGINGAGATPLAWEKMPAQNTNSPLDGAWRISHREGQDGQMNPMVPGPRKTIKVLSSDRFQWIAFNSATGGFFGTGGGTYTAQNGKYTEHLEFFSRDNNRVGMALSFNFAMKDGNWHHSGLSSTGNNINEIWQRLSKQ